MSGHVLTMPPELAGAAELLAGDERDLWDGPPTAAATHSGRLVDLLSPTVEDIDLREDVAFALAKITRWGGHANGWCSVAEHSVLVADLITDSYPGRPAWALAGLLHDAHEAYTVDLPTYVKKAIRPTHLRIVVDALDQAICDHVRTITPADLHASHITIADYKAAMVEAAAWLPGPWGDWCRRQPGSVLPVTVRWDGNLPPDQARTLFLKRLDELAPSLAPRSVWLALERAIATVPKHGCTCEERGLHSRMTREELIAFGAGCGAPRAVCSRLDKIRGRVR